MGNKKQKSLEKGSVNQVEHLIYSTTTKGLWRFVARDMFGIKQ